MDEKVQWEVPYESNYQTVYAVANSHRRLDYTVVPATAV